MSAVVFDLEWTAWEGSWQRGWSGPGEHREIVQIGAVRVDDQWREVAASEVLVRPRLNPLLSDYFTQLTGITQDMVERDGLDFAQAQALFADFAGPSGTLFSNGADAAVIAENCRLLGVAEAIPRHRFHDARALIGALAGRAAINSCDLASVLGVDGGGRGHSALADARSVAGALRLASQRGLL